MADTRPTLNQSEVTLRQAITEALFQFPLLVETSGGSGEELYEIEDQSHQLPANCMLLLEALDTPCYAHVRVGRLEDEAQTTGRSGKDTYEIEDQQHQLPSNCMLLLEALDTPCYAHVRVGRLEDEAQVVRDKGEEYVAEYNELLGQEFLVPASLPHKLNIVHKPGTKRRYTTMAQVVDYPPRYLKAETDILSCVPGSDTLVKVKKGAVLEVVKVFSSDKVAYLRCVQTKTNKVYFFSQSTSVSFTAVDDTTPYTLTDIISKQLLLPKVVRFQECVSPTDVVEYDDDSAARALLITFGPLEILAQRRRHVIAGWLRIKDGSCVSYRRVLVPSSHWDSIRVRVFSFSTVNTRKAYCRRKFQVASGGTSSWQDNVYMLRPEAPDITYLSGCGETTGVVDDDSSGESSGYETPIKTSPPPVVPTRQVIQMKDTEGGDTPTAGNSTPVPLPTRKVRPDAMQKVLEKARSGFGHLHHELLYLFKVRAKTQTAGDRLDGNIDTNKQKSQVQPIVRGNEYVKTAVATRQHTDRSSSRNNRETWNPEIYIHPVADDGGRSGSPGVERRFHSDKESRRKDRETWNPTFASQSEDKQTVQPGVKARPLPPPPSPADILSQEAPPRPPPKPVSRSASAPGMKPPGLTSPDNRKPLPLPVKTVDEEQEEVLYDYPDVKDWVPAGKAKAPAKATAATKVSAVDTQKVVPTSESVPETSPDDRKSPAATKASATGAQAVASVNQTGKDFQNYTVSQVGECFRLCALTDLAQICEHEKIDGKFLATSDLDGLLKDDPFCLSAFALRKVKMIVNDGWRPSFDNT